MATALDAARVLAHRLMSSPWTPKKWRPHPKQLAFLLDESREALYGGAAGGGKSEALLAGASMYVDYPAYSAILFRKTHTDLAQPGALMDRAHEWWHNTKARWDGTNKIWRFPSGAKVALAYMKNPNDHLRYQGAEYQFVGFDELTQFPETQYRYVGLSRMRRLTGSPIPLRLRGGTNPGGPGHLWVKSRFIDPWRLGNAVRPFYPATIDDNPSLNRDEYIESLEGLHPTVREQLLRGDWDVRDPGDYFRREWFGPPLEEPWPAQEKVTIRWWDLAGSAKEEDDKGQRARTAGVKVSKHLTGQYAVEHALAKWLTSGARDEMILQTAHADGFEVVVGVEQEPGSGGLAQAETIRRMLRRHGFRCVIEPATAKKEERASPVASELERGFNSCWEIVPDGPDDRIGRARGVRIVAGAWMQPYLDEVEAFPEIDLMDQADATASAFNWLKGKAVGGGTGGQIRRKPDIRPPDAYPEDYAEAEEEAQEAIRTTRFAGLGAEKRWHRSHRKRRW